MTLIITAGPVLWVPVALAAVVFAALLLRRPTERVPARRWIVEVVIALAVGAAVGAVAAMIASWLEVMEDPVPWAIGWIATAALASLALCVLNLLRGPAARRWLAGAGVVVVALATVLGVNAYLGIDRTLGSLLNVQPYPAIALPAVDPGAEPVDAASWQAPAGLDAHGRVGSAEIPASGFDPRPAGIYLPPAALVEDPPALPLMVFMFGYPGVPDPTIVAEVMDDHAAAHDGLAPIVIVADQIGAGGANPVCADSPLGDARTYIVETVPAWARAHLNISADPADWVIAGYSAGGACATQFAAAHPDVFGNLLSASGELYPGYQDDDQVIAQVYGGDAAAFDASKPAAIFERRAGEYGDMVAVFTYGADDPNFGPSAAELARAAEAAGIRTALRELAGVEHIRGAVPEGLRAGMDVLGPVLFGR